MTTAGPGFGRPPGDPRPSFLLANGSRPYITAQPRPGEERRPQFLRRPQPASPSEHAAAMTFSETPPGSTAVIPHL